VSSCCRPPARFILEIDVSERLGRLCRGRWQAFVLVGSPRRREAAGRLGQALAAERACGRLMLPGWRSDRATPADSRSAGPGCCGVWHSFYRANLCILSIDARQILELHNGTSLICTAKAVAQSNVELVSAERLLTRFRSRGRVSCMSEVIGAFLRAECGHKRADSAREARNGWFGSFPEMCLEFAEGLLDRVEVRGIFGKITELAPAASITSRTAATLWTGRLSIITTSPRLSFGTRHSLR